MDIKLKSVRNRLKPRGEPYGWTRESGKHQLYVGYRKTERGPGTWVARLQTGTKRIYKTLGTLGNDFTYDDAAEKARGWLKRQLHGVNIDLTVWAVCEAYLGNLNGKPVQQVKRIRQRLEKLVRAHTIGDKLVAELTAADMRAWRTQQVKATSVPTANRDLGAFRATLNWGYENDLIAEDHAWKKVRALEDDAPRKRETLTRKQRRRLIEAASPEVANVIKALLHTGARPGLEGILGARVADFEKPTARQPIGRFHSSTRKGKGKVNRFFAELTDEASAFFTELARDKLPQAWLFTQANGKPWTSNKTFLSAFHRAVKAAGLQPDITPYALRHTVISEWVVQGVSLLTAAKWAGTSLEMVSKTYGHLLANGEVHKLNQDDYNIL